MANKKVAAKKSAKKEVRKVGAIKPVKKLPSKIEKALTKHPFTGDKKVITKHPLTGDKKVIAKNPFTGDKKIIIKNPFTGKNI